LGYLKFRTTFCSKLIREMKPKNVRIAKTTTRYVPSNIMSRVYVRKTINSSHIVLAARDP
jgi:hypothetical protein